MAEQPMRDDEIDLVELIQTLWAGKWTIALITLVFTLLGGLILFFIPNSYTGSTPAYPARSSVFVPFTTLNEVLNNDDFALKINRNTVFDRFVEEFTDYQEVIDVVRQSEYVKSKAADLNDAELELFVIEKAKQFQLLAPRDDGETWQIKFEWIDAETGKQLFNQALSQVLLNIKEGFVHDLNELGRVLDDRIGLRKERLNAELKTIEESVLLDKEHRLLFLNEQSAVAKELGIKNNALNTSELDQAGSRGVSLNVTSADVPYYLRGYKAINKEISLLKSRSQEELLLLNNSYIKLKKQLVALENNVSKQQLIKTKALVDNTRAHTWIEYDLNLIEIKPKVRLLLGLILVISLSVLLGIIYVLIFSKLLKKLS